MAPPASLRDWIALLEREGELVRVDAEVDPDLEVTEIVDRTVKAGGPALLFTNPKGSDHPLLINQFGTERRMCLAFDAPSLDAVAAKLGDVLEMQPPQGIAEKVKGLKKLKSIADSRPKTVRSGPVHEVVLTGDDVDLDLLPIQRCWPGDPAPFITLPAVITHDPQHGDAERRHVPDAEGRRADDPDALAAAQGRAHADYLATDGRIEVAVALGLDPVTAYSASAPLPKHIDEFMLAGFLKGEPVELVKGKTVGVEVPANAEIVLEGYVEKGEQAPEGPVRRPHRLLHTRRAVPGLPRDRADDAARRDLPLDRRRQAAPGGRLARQGDRADLPARGEDDGARDRRLRPAGRRRVPQPLHRLDPQGLPRPRAQGDARALGARACSR